MEAAGLVIGVVGLAGIFGRVVDLFGLFTAAQSLEYDADLLITSLNVERVLLIRWAEEIRLIEDDYDKRLDDLHIRMLVIRVLKHMEDLMNDARRLEITYGVYDIQSSQVSTMQLLSRDESSQKSASSFNGFLRDFDNYKSRAIQGFSRHAAFTKRVRWAIRDKDKFMILVNDLKKFRIQLKEIVPPRIELDHISLINVASQKPGHH
uniref:Small s protein-like protein n=1 Tax=Colletotrichum fructicola (strain Nara gc5) TaxID=1213859 RepID=L2FD20_COLFN